MRRSFRPTRRFRLSPALLTPVLAPGLALILAASASDATPPLLPEPAVAAAPANAPAGPGLAPAARDHHPEMPDPNSLEPGSRQWLKVIEASRRLSAVRSTAAGRIDNCPHDFDVLHYRIELTIDFTGQTIAGTTRVRSVVETAGLDHLDLELLALQVDGVTLPDGTPLDFAHASPSLRIELGSAHAAGDTIEVDVAYHGQPANEGPSGFGGFYFNTSAGIAYQMAVGLSADPPSMGKYWFPCWDWPCDKATAEYHITVPDGKMAVCNGAFIGSRPAADGRSVTWSWSETHQISPHVMSVAACGYVELVDSTYPWIRYWVYPNQVTNAATHFSNVHTMMDAFISRYGPYPFDKFGYASAPKGDMEHQTCVTHLAGTVLPNHTYDWLLAHEMSHQWWGDCVSVNDWRDVWLSEGFATYSEAIFQEYAYGVQTYRTYMQNSLMNPVFNSSENFPIYDPEYLWGTTVYEKGGCVLHMLRGVVGDACFFDALAAYRAAHEHGNAVTPQFQEAVEAACGQDLDWFFQEWIHDVGWPEYRYAWVGQQGSGGSRLLLAIDQTQTNGPTFTMPVGVKVTTAAGDTLLTLWVDERHEFFDLHMPGAPTAVALDPDNWILNRATEAPAASIGEPGPWGPDVPGPGDGLAPSAARIRPNPFSRETSILLQVEPTTPIRVEVLDVTGRRVRTLAALRPAVPELELRWEGRDDDGRALPSGAYFLRVVREGEQEPGTPVLPGRLLLIR